MEQRFSVITIGVADTAKVRDFYEALGWKGTSPDPDGHPWEVSHNPGWGLDEDGRVVLPKYEH